MTALPGLTPRSPEIIDGPVLVTAAPANTANDVAVPNPTGACTDAADATGAAAIPPTRPMAVMAPTASVARTLRRGLSPRVTRVTDITNPPINEYPNGRHAREQWDMPCAVPVFLASTSAGQCGDAAAGFLTRPLSANLELAK